MKENGPATRNMTVRSFACDFIIPAIGYFLIARLSLLLAVPPSEAAAVWPPAGIAIATILLRGYRSWIAIYISELVINYISWVDTSSSTALLYSGGLVFLLSIGPTVQALLVAYLINRFSEPRLIFLSERSIIRFMFILIPIGCLSSASWGVVVLFQYQIIQSQELPLSWLTWWAGDTIGAITVTPLLLVFLLPNSSDLKSRRLTVGVPMLMLLAIVFGLFQLSQYRDETESRGRFELQAHRQYNELNAAFDQGINSIYSLKYYFEGSEYVTPEEFAGFSSNLLDRYAYVYALEWIPRVDAAHKKDFEKNRDGPGKITQTDAQGNLTIADSRDVYYPVKYVSPMQGNERAYGYDVSSNPIARRAQKLALQTGEATATRPIKLVQESRDQSGVVVYLPVYFEQSFAGYVAAVIRITDFIEGIIGRSANARHNLRLRLSDITEGIYPIFDNVIPGEVKRYKPLGFSGQLDFFGRQWRIDYFPTTGFFDERPGSGSLVILLGGMLFTALTGGWLLSLTGRTLQISREVERRTYELKREVAERKEREAEKDRLQRELLQAHKMEALGQLTGGIAHDFNNILGIITGYSELAQSQCLKNGEHKTAEHLGTVLNAVERAKNLVGQMMDFSRNETRANTPIALPPLVENELKMLRPTLPASIETIIEIDDDLPLVMISPIQLNQMLINLCVNARDAMEGRGKLFIRLGWVVKLDTECAACHEKVEGDWVELSVADTGTGINAEELGRIFDPFHTTKEVGKGTGMGLSIVHRIMRNLGGHILVDTSQSSGSSIRLLFPPVHEKQGIAPPEGNSSSSRPLQGNGEQVLIVDDEPDLARVFGDFLDSHGYKTVVLSSSQEALACFKKNPDGFSMLITDQTMPEMTGKVLITEARKLRPDLPVILITGYSDQINETSALAMGISYLRKPVSRDSLLQSVGGVLQSDL